LDTEENNSERAVETFRTLLEDDSGP